MSGQSAWVAGAWRAARPVAAVLGVVALVLGMHWPTLASLFDAWNRSVTYSHGYLVLPAFAWLVWGSRHRLMDLPIRPAWPGLVALVFAAALWCVARLLAVSAPAQFALIAMVPAALAATLGLAWVRTLAYALAFLFLAVPFGEDLVPVMMELTARTVVSALNASGIPAYREGTHFSIPSGEWSVVESCSGVRYLFAGLTVACLFSWSAYRTWTRRTALIVFAVVVIVAANWLRAYGIVVVGHLSGNRVAVGVDHLVYGAGFFLVVMAIVFLVGAIWRDPPEAPRAPDAHRQSAAGPGGAAVTLPLSAAAAILVAGPLAIAEEAPNPGSMGQTPIAEPTGWQSIGEHPSLLQPSIENPARRWRRAYIQQGPPVMLEVGVFGRPVPQAKLYSSQNRLVRVDDANRAVIDRSVRVLECAGQPASVASSSIASREGRTLAWQWFRVDGKVTANPVRAGALQLLSRIRGRSEQGDWIAAWTTQDDGTQAAMLRLQALFSDICESERSGVAARRSAAGAGNGSGTRLGR